MESFVKSFELVRLLRVTMFVFISHFFLYVDSTGLVANQSSTKPKKIPISQDILPDVSDAMLTPDYWLEKLLEPNKLVWNKQQVIAYNKKNASRGYVLNPMTLGNYIRRSSVRNYIKSDFDFIRSYIKYDLDGVRHRDPKFNNWLKEIVNYKELELPAEANESSDTNINSIKLIYGLVVHKDAELRYFPAKLKIYRKPDDREFEILKKSHLETLSVVSVLHQSADKNWLYVETPISRGWVERRFVVLGDRLQIKNFFSKENSGVVVNPLAKVFTSPSKEDRAVSKDYALAMGTKVYYRNYNPGEDFVAIILPVEMGDKLEKKTFYLWRDDFSKDYLPFTYKNIAKQAFKFLGTRYSWGGAVDKTDCSLFLYRVFASFGLQLPRSSSQQIKSVSQIAIGRNEYELHSKKLAPLTSISYIPGPTHIMLYLGNNQGKDYYIQSTWSYYDSKQNEYLMQGVVVSELSLGKGSKQGSLEEKISAVGLF